ncbi:MAG: cytochrome c [bacterium]|nr:cytochrome c [bacterium]
MKQIKIAAVVGSFLLSIACATTPTNTTTANKSTPVPTATVAATPADELAGGRELYKQNCAICHKEEGMGGKMTIEGKTINPDDLTSDKIKKFTDEKIAGYIANGVIDEGMPAFKDKLSEAQIRDVVAYVRRGIQKIEAVPAL